MGKFVDIGKAFLGYSPLIGLAVVLLTLLVNNHKGLYETWLGIKAQRFIHLKEAIESPGLSPQDKEALESELSYLHLKRATGMIAPRAVIEALLHVYDKSEHRVRLYHFQRIAPFAEVVEEQKLVIKMPITSYIWTLISAGFVVISWGVFFVGFWVLREKLNLEVTLQLLSLPFMSFIYFREFMPLLSIRYVNDEYERQNAKFNSQTVDVEVAS